PPVPGIFKMCLAAHCHPIQVALAAYLRTRYETISAQSQFLRSPPHTFRHIQERFIPPVPGGDGSSVSWQSKKLADRSPNPIYGPENDWNNSGLTLGMSL